MSRTSPENATTYRPIARWASSSCRWLSDTSATLAEMADDKLKTQKTTPKGKNKKGEPYEPIEVPALKRGTFDRLLGNAAKGRSGKPRH